MLFHKQKSTLTISGGTGSINTPGMRGFVERIIITPTTSTNVWSMTLADRDGDIIYVRDNETGRVIDPIGMPVGLDSLERFTISFTSVSINEPISVIFRNREKM